MQICSLFDNITCVSEILSLSSFKVHQNLYTVGCYSCLVGEKSCHLRSCSIPECHKNIPNSMYWDVWTLCDTHNGCWRGHMFHVVLCTCSYTSKKYINVQTCSYQTTSLRKKCICSICCYSTEEFSLYPLHEPGIWARMPGDPWTAMIFQ